MSVNTININLDKVQSDVFIDLAKMDNMTVEPYGEVKKFLDEKARKTMYKLKDIINDTLSFEGDKNER